MPIVALAGNPNTGKTTLFNALTGENRTTGNWPGVTTEKREGRIFSGGAEYTLIDLPGTYSMNSLTREERITEDFLKNGGADVIINVVNPKFLARELYFTYRLFELSTPIILAVNMLDEAEKGAFSLNTHLLSEALGIPVVSVSGKTGKGLDALTKLLNSPAAPPIPTARTDEEIRTDIRSALAKALYSVSAADVFSKTHRLDKWLLGKYTAFPLLLLIMLLIFFFAFGPPGTLLTALIDRFFTSMMSLSAPALRLAPDWAYALMTDGVLTGVFSVLVFLPQVTVLYFLISFIEESGYMARAAFITDRLLRKIGLSGRSMIPMLMGLGCTTGAISSTRGIDSEKDRKMTVMLTPFLSCGAKMPIYAMVASEFFAGYAPLVIFSLYVLGFLVLSCVGAALNRFLFHSESDTFFLELPPCSLPDAREIFTKSLRRIGEFARRAGTVIVLTSAGAWFLSYYTPALVPAQSPNASLLSEAGRRLSFQFEPLGFGSWQAVSALLSGAFAKESILSALRILAPEGGALGSAKSAYSFLVFILLSPPCASALAAIRREIKSLRLFFGMLALEILLAFSFSYLVMLCPF